MEPFALVEDVQRRLDFVLDEREEEAVSAHLEDMSNEARYIAGREWPEPESAPYEIRTTVIISVTRWAKNMNAITLSRAGDETVEWDDVKPEHAVPWFTPQEQKKIKAIGDGRRGYFLGTVEMVAYLPENGFAAQDDGMIPVASMQTPFPMFNPATDGW
jgi:hypothetical protein